VSPLRRVDLRAPTQPLPLSRTTPIACEHVA